MIRHKNSYMDFNKLRNNIFYENFNKNKIVKNKNINNSKFIEENYKTFNNISKRNEFNNHKANEQNYFSYLMNKENFYHKNNKKNEENKNTN